MQKENLIAEKVKNYFESHPDATEVYEALGVLFGEKERAEKFLKGVAGRFVTTHTPTDIVFEKVSQEIRQEIINQEHVVNAKQLAYEDAAGVDKEKVMNDWHTEKTKLERLHVKYDKQVQIEDKDELIAKEDKETGIRKPLTADEVKVKITAQELIVAATQAIIDNKKIVAKKRKDAEKVLAKEKAKLKKLNADLVKLEAETKSEEPANEMVDVVVTQEILDMNPEMVEQGLKVGDIFQITKKADTNSGESGDIE